MSKELIRREQQKQLSTLFSKPENKILYGFFANLRSPHTVKAYKNDIGQFRNFLNDYFRKVALIEADHDHLVAYKNFLLQESDVLGPKKSDKTINRKLASLSHFYQYLCARKLITQNPVQYIERIKVDRLIKTQDLTDQEVREIFKVIDDSTYSGALHKAMLSVLFSTGMRKSEILGLKFECFKKIEGIYILEYLGKGHKKMQTPLNPFCLEAIFHYLQKARAKKLPFNQSDYLFRPGRNPMDGELNKRIDAKTLTYIMKKYCLKAGIDKDVTVHSARSTVIGSLLDRGVDLFKVAEFVGHQDINTTKSYSKRKTKLRESAAFELDLLDEKFDQKD